jgi:phosphatidylserine/phosphatidylglycerophosphate/cardiolipin synthase-like enzyme
VNGFPLALELQHALLRALRRGVRVRVLTGHLTPTHDGTPFRGPWSSARTTATEFVHSRLDPIVEAGGEVHALSLRDVPGWESLGVVGVHVHAKLMSADGLRCAVGSANFDVTSSYWESELMVVVEDAQVARRCEERLQALCAGSPPVDRNDPAWRERARRRRWMRRWPGVLAV